MKKVLSIVLSVILAASLMTGCGGGTSSSAANTPNGNAGAPAGDGKPQTGGILNIGTFADPDTLNPLYGNDMAGSWILGLIYPTLFEIDEEGNKIPYIIEEPIYSEDGQEVKIKLLSGLKWEDGTPLTTKDIDYTFKVLYDTKAQWQWTMLEGVTWEIVDDLNMTFKLEKPFPTFITSLGFWQRILPAHIWSQMPNEELKSFQNDQPVGMGPYKLVKFERGQYYTLERVEGFPISESGGPWIDKINFIPYPDTNTMVLALKSGTIDITAKEIPAMTAKDLEKDSDFTVERNLSLGYEHISLNLKNPVTADLAVRKALAMTMDRKKIGDFAYDGDYFEMNTPISPVYKEFDYGLTLPAYDIEGAKKVLEDAGYKDTNGDGIVEKDGKPLSLSLMYAAANTEHGKIATVVAENAKQAGIEILVKPLDKAVQTEKIYSETDTEWQLSLGSWGILDDIHATIMTLFHTSTNLNFGDWSNPTADKAMETLTSLSNKAEIDTQMKLFQEEYLKDIPDIPLVVKKLSYAYNHKFAGQKIYPSNLRGLVGPLSITEMYLVQK